ncbi:MAG TPA: hypothetical protein VFB13_02465 [Reyranella sp.]|jgi:hypothetical protein|nr:hypothetical protein [Reyranella sp.]
MTDEPEIPLTKQEKSALLKVMMRARQVDDSDFRLLLQRALIEPGTNGPRLTAAGRRHARLLPLVIVRRPIDPVEMVLSKYAERAQRLTARADMPTPPAEDPPAEPWFDMAMAHRWIASARQRIGHTRSMLDRQRKLDREIAFTSRRCVAISFACLSASFQTVGLETGLM